MSGPLVIYALCFLISLLLLAAVVLHVVVWMGAKRLRDDMATKRPVIRFDVKKKRQP